MYASFSVFRKVLLLCGLLFSAVLAYYLGAPVRQAADLAGVVKLVDEQEGRVYLARRGQAEVRVLMVRGGVSEIARLRTRSPVLGFSLDAASAHLTVFTTDSTQSFNVHTWRPLS